MRPGRNSQEEPWGRILVPHQWIHITISLSCSSDTETPSRWEKLTINDGMLPPNTQTLDLSGLKVDNADSYSFRDA